MLVDLCTKQLPPVYSRLLWVPTPSSPSQEGDQDPSSTLMGGFLLTWGLSSLAAVHYLPKWRNPALKGWILPKGWGALPPLGDSSHKASGWPQMRPFSSKWGVSRPMHQMLQPRVPGNKLTQKDNTDSGLQFIAPAGPRHSLLLPKDPNQLLWKSFIPHVYMSEPTTPNSLRPT